jgi:hypothetical protein
VTAIREFCALEMEEVPKLTNTGRETECSDSLVYASIALGSIHDKHFDNVYNGSWSMCPFRCSS